MIFYIIDLIRSKIISDDKLLIIAKKLISSIVYDTCEIKEAKALMISDVLGIVYVAGKRFVKFKGFNVSAKPYELLICDTGVISMNRWDGLFKQIDHKYSLYIKEI